jgi:ATP synthase protein I
MSGDHQRKPDGSGETPATRDPSAEARHARLKADLERVRQRSVGTVETDRREAATSSGLAQGLRLSSEFVAGILAGALLGWVLDRLANSAPWGLIAGVILGFCAGMLNVLRASGKVQDPVDRSGR